jgi:phosphoadenosine phosphosulfate reductase
VNSNLWGKSLDAVAIERIKHYAERAEWLGLDFNLMDSGGKDSCVILHLAQRAGVKFKAYHNLTTVDPPELVRFVREKHQDTIINKPKMTMWDLIIKKKMPPTRRVRYCCEYLKEQTVSGFSILGVRWAESAKRSTRPMFGYFRNQPHINPIIDWEDSDIWDYIRAEGIPYCELYNEGCKRLGCIGCPLASKHQREWEFRRWPKYKAKLIRCFDRVVNIRIAELQAEPQYRTQKRRVKVWDDLEEEYHYETHRIQLSDASGNSIPLKKKRKVEWKWTTGQEMFDWWMGEGDGCEEGCALFE